MSNTLKMLLSLSACQRENKFK